MARGFVYLVAVVDWFSRRVLAWRLSITMDVSFCIEALEEALSKYGKPEIFNTDQGTQFTSEAFTGRLKKEGIAISMDGKGRWCDNVFVERLWRSLKYEHVYLHAYETVAEARSKIGRYLEFYNGQPSALQPGSTNARPGILPPSAGSAGGLTRNQAGRGNAGLMESAENDETVFRPSHKTLKIDEADFHIPTATNAN